MIPVKQTGDDCWAACVASILELDMDSVPPYRSDEDWVPEWQSFLLSRNLFQMTVPVDRTWKSVPPGWSILLSRTTSANSAKLDHQRHAIVCRNGRPVWDPNGYRLPLKWDGLIKSRSWQIVEPVAWTMFATLDPTLPATAHVTGEVPSFKQLVDEARPLLEKLHQRTTQYREGIEYPVFFNNSDEVIAAYTDAPSDTAGEEAVLTVLRALKKGSATSKCKEMQSEK